MKLDEQLRARLGRLADEEGVAEIDAFAVARVAAQTARETERGRTRRMWSLGALVLAPAAAAAAWALGMTAPGRAPTPVPQCASWLAPRDADPASERIDFGGRALAVAERGAEVSVGQSTSCAVRLDLMRGRVTIHARDLGGGELRVRAGGVDAVVRGTVFAVERSADGTVFVDVAEGRVIGERAGAGIASARAGERFVVHGAVTETVPLDEQVASALRVAVGIGRPPEAVHSKPPSAAPAHPEPPAVSPTAIAQPVRPAKVRPPIADILSRARAATRAHEYDDARGLYREAGVTNAADAEAAWLDLARLEITVGRGDAARDALHERRQRFGDTSPLALEAANAEFRLERGARNRDAAMRVARRISEGWPGTPYAAQAQRFLTQEEGGAR